MRPFWVLACADVRSRAVHFFGRNLIVIFSVITFSECYRGVVLQALAVSWTHCIVMFMEKIFFLEVSHPSIPSKRGLATVTTWQQLDDSSSRRGGSIISLLTLSRMLTLTALTLTDRSWRLKVFYIGCALIGFLQQAISWSLSKSHPHASVRVVRSIKRRGGFGELSKKREQIADSWKMVKYQFCRSCR